MPVKANTKMIKVKIIEQGLTQSQLSEEFGVSKQTMNGWVNGRIVPPLRTALRMSDRLKCNVNELWEFREE